MLADAAVNESGIPSTAVPSGFTIFSNCNVSLTDTRAILSFKKATGSEAGATLTGMTNNGGGVRTLVVFQTNVPTTTLTQGGGISSGMTNSNPAAQIITSGSGTAPLVVVAMYYASGVISTRSFTPTADAEVTGPTPGNKPYIKYKIYNSSPADVTIDMDDSGFGNVVQGGYLQAT